MPKNKSSTLEEKIEQLEKRLQSLQKELDPYLKEQEAKLESQDKILISCDASITKNPGGDASYGVVIRLPGMDPLPFASGTPSKTNNEAELDAIYQGLENFSSFHLFTAKNIKKLEVRTDSQFSIDLIKEKKKTKLERLNRKVNIIRDLTKSIELLTGMKIEFTWKARNSTRDLEEANYLAQDILNVKRH